MPGMLLSPRSQNVLNISWLNLLPRCNRSSIFITLVCIEPAVLLSCLPSRNLGGFFFAGKNQGKSQAKKTPHLQLWRLMLRYELRRLSLWKTWYHSMWLIRLKFSPKIYIFQKTICPCVWHWWYIHCWKGSINFGIFWALVTTKIGQWLPRPDFYCACKMMDSIA